MRSESQSDAFAFERERMVALQLRARGILDEYVLAAMARVPRHEFVAPEYRSQAYGDHPLPIGHGQTISQPYIVALMLEDLALQPTQTVLEVGTGSGYVTALLAELTSRVYSIERYAALARSAENTLTRLGYSNVTVIVGDGGEGLPAQAPFDAILVSAAALSVPPALFEQLQEGGRMAIPIGSPELQDLHLVRKQNSQPVTSILEGCRFVPLIRGADAAKPS
jgi:protein-L-isoaspartate(D-aspartate) O-methyltransferase